MSKRSYRQNCALARAKDVNGERWTLLMVRDLLVAPRRFNELLGSLKGIGSNLLAQRLKDLEAGGILDRVEGEGGARAYALTDRGRALELAVLALVRWGLEHGPESKEGDHHHNDWDLLALKSVFQPQRTENLSLTVRFDADDLHGWARIADGQMTIGLVPIPDADITIDGTVADLFLSGREPTRLLASGDPADLERFMAAFALGA